MTASNAFIESHSVYFVMKAFVYKDCMMNSIKTYIYGMVYTYPQETLRATATPRIRASYCN